MLQYFSNNNFLNYRNSPLNINNKGKVQNVIDKQEKNTFRVPAISEIMIIEVALRNTGLVKNAAIIEDQSTAGTPVYTAFIVPYLVDQFKNITCYGKLNPGYTRRSEFRIQYKTVCKVKLINKKNMPAFITELNDLSSNGAAIRNKKFNINNKDQVELYFHLNIINEKISIKAEVANISENKIGLKFIPADQNVKRIIDWINAIVRPEELMVMDYRRAHYRITAGIPCAVKDKNGNTVNTETWDISANGIAVRALPTDFLPGTESEITLFLKEKEQKVSGRIIWNNGQAAGIQLQTASQLFPADLRENINNVRLMTTLEKKLRESLPDFLIPHTIHILHSLPLVPDRSVDKKALADMQASLKNRSSAPSITTKHTSFMEDNFPENKSSIFDILKTGDWQSIFDYFKPYRQQPYLRTMPARYQNIYPLTRNQKRIYMTDRLHPDSTHTARVKAFILAGNINKEELEKYFKVMITRHEALRTGFEVLGDDIYQKIYGSADFTIDYREQDDQTVDDIIKASEVAYDLSRPPLFKICLIKAASGEFILAFYYHRIILDDYSIPVIMDEITKLLNGEKLPPLTTQHKDYALWQDGQLPVSRDKTRDEYWLREFQDTAPMLNLATDYPRPNIQSFTGAVCTFTITQDITTGLEHLASSTDTNLDLLLLAAFKTLLYRYTGQENIVLGAGIERRNKHRPGQAAGMFANTVILPSRPTGDLSFSAYLKAIHTVFRNAYQDQEYQLDTLIDKLKSVRDPSRNYLFDAAFILQDYPVQGQEEYSFHYAPYVGAYRDISLFDLTLEVMRYDNTLTCTFEYCTGLFKHDTILRMGEHFANLLDSITRNPEEKLSALNLLSGDETHKLLYAFNNNALEYPQDKTISRLFEAQVDKTPEHTAVVYRDNKLTYRELDMRANRLAHFLVMKTGVKPDTLVGIFMNESIEFIVAIFGILKAGGAYVPLNPALPEKRVKEIIDDAHLEVIITAAEHSEVLNILQGECPDFNYYLCLDRAVVPLAGNAPTGSIQASYNGSIMTDKHFSLKYWENKKQKYQLGNNILKVYSTERMHTDSHSGNLAYAIYTSGSTGKSKGVLVEHKALVNLCAWHNIRYAVTAEDRATKYASVGFDASVWEIFPYLITGASLHIIDNAIKYNPLLLNAYFEEQNISISFLPTQMCEEFMKLDNSSLRIMLTGGDKLKQFIKKNYLLVNNYGPTENAVVTTSYDVLSYTNNIPIGKPVNNCQIYILSPAGQLQPVGIPGELCIAGDSLARGYLNRPELTKEKFADNPLMPGSRIYKTGDLARWLPDGNIEFLGRIDFQVKIRGYRIELGEIENRLLKQESIKEAIVIDVDKECVDETSGEKSAEKFLCAYFTADQKLSASGLKEFLALELPDYMIPACFMQLDKLPLNINGKIDRKALPPVTDFSLGGTDYIPPVTEIEKIVTSLWQKGLGINKIGIEDNFFSLGGHSLKATIMITEIQKIFNVKIPLQEIFSNPTIKKTASYIQEAKQEITLPLKPAPVKEYYPLSSAQKRMFIVNQFTEENISYNEVLAMSIDGNPDVNRLETVFQAIMERHEILRTGFEVIGKDVYQKVYGNLKFYLEYFEDTRTKPDDLITHFKRPYDLKAPPLFRAGLVKTGDQQYIFIIGIHHIVCDGASLAILIKEFSTLYNDGKLPELSIQYKDYAEWQNQLLTSQTIKKQEAYWLKKFEAEVPVLNLPADYPRPVIKSFEGDLFSFNLKNELMEGLYKLIKNTNTTLYMVLLAVFKTLLYRYTGQEELEIGSGIANRNHSDLYDLQGMFVNMLILRSNPTGNKQFLDYLIEIRKEALESIENQDYQFDVLVDRLHWKRDSSRNPLFDVVFVLQNINMPEIKIAGLEFKPYASGHRTTAKFDLTLEAIEKEHEIQFNIEYCTKLFKKETIERLSCHFTNIIKAVTADSRVTLSEIEIMTQDEKLRLLTGFNNTDFPYPRDKTIHQLFEEQAARTPDHAALVYGKTSLTYKELDRNASRLAHFLAANAVLKPGSLAGVLMQESFDMFVAILGILKAGGAYVPIDPALPENRIKEILLDSGAGVVIADKQQIKKLNRLQWECPAFNHFLCLDCEDVYTEEETEKNQLMDKKLWHYVGEEATDAITGGGWKSSYTGMDLSPEEMEEYAENTLIKLQPFLNKQTRVLEIGCASGLSLFKLAPHVGYYYGTDLSEVIIEKNRAKIQAEGLMHIKLRALAAHEIDQITEKDFDIVIINSVIQCFHGHNYLRRVLLKAITHLKEKGILYIGDIMDQDTKEELIASLVQFKKDNKNPAYKTKTDFSQELFVSRKYFEDLAADTREIQRTFFFKKVCTIENELTRFRYDAILQIDKTLSASTKQGSKHKFQYGNKVLEPAGAKLPEIRTNPDDPAYVIYTSGSTGKPKGVLVEHRALVNLCTWHNDRYAVTAADRATKYAGLGFDASVWEIFPYLVKGASVHIIGNDIKYDPVLLNAYFEAHKITISFLPTQMCEEFMKLDNHSLRIMLTGGDKLKQFIKKDYLLVNNYGPTENAVVTTSYDVLAYAHNIPIGKPLYNCRIYILSRAGKLQPTGIPGELCIAGDNLARGYLNRPELTGEKFTANPLLPGTRIYRTGDLARWLPDGNIEFLGRMDNQVKVRGFRIELGEIESRLIKCEDIKEVCVINREGEDKEQYLYAYFTANRKISPSGLKDALAEELPAYMIPAYFIQIDKMPLNPSGKIDRKGLPEPSDSIRGCTEEHVAPTNAIETALVAIWEDILKVKGIGICDNFFNLGGHSLKTTVLAEKIRDHFQVDIPLLKIFQTPTIKEIAHFIGSNKTPGKREKDKNLILLRKSTHPSEKFIFLIHSGNGEVGTYFKFAKQLSPEFTVYSIRAGRLPGYAPIELTIEELAQRYVEKIRQVQEQGPYYVMGWCFGGAVAFEIAHQLEKINEEIAFIGMINTDAPDRSVWDGEDRITIASELDYIGKWLKDDQLINHVRNSTSVTALWQSVVEYLNSQTDGTAKLKATIDEDQAKIIPNYAHSTIGDIIAYLNLCRTFNKTRNYYAPANSGIHHEIHFFIPADAMGHKIDFWRNFTDKQVNYHTVKGNHTSIFSLPHLTDFVAECNKLLQSADAGEENRDV